jgi:hypothetical protein
MSKLFGALAARADDAARIEDLVTRPEERSLNADARHFIVSACTASREAQYSERDDVLRRKSNLRGSEAKSDPRARRSSQMLRHPTGVEGRNSMSKASIRFTIIIVFQNSSRRAGG